PVTRNIGLLGGPFEGIETEEVSELLAGGGADDLLGHAGCRLRIALEEGRRDELAAVEEGGDDGDTLQRLYGKSVTEGGGDRIDRRPALGQQRSGRFRDLGPQAVEQPHPLQEVVMLLHAYRQRHARGADVGGMDEDLGDGQYAALA